MKALKIAVLGALFLGLGQQASAACWYVIDHYKTVCSDCRTCNWNPQPCIEVPVYRKVCDDGSRGGGAAKASKAQEALEQAQSKAEAAHQEALLAVEKALGLLNYEGKSTAEERKQAAAEARQKLKAEREALLENAKAQEAAKKAESPLQRSFSGVKEADATAKPLDGNCIGGKECPRKGDFSVCCPEGFPYYSGCDKLCHVKKPWDCGDLSKCKP